MNKIILTCKKHGELKIEETFIASKNPIKYRFRYCQRIYMKKGQSKNKGKYYGTTKKIISTRNSNFKKRNKISPEEYEELLDGQNGLCAICNKPETKIDYRKSTVMRLSVDHCHESNKIRGLLCSKCNISLGGFCDSIVYLQSAIDYLKRTIK